MIQYCSINVENVLTVTQKKIWYQFSLRHQSMKRNRNQPLKRCLEVMFLNDNF